MIEAHNNKSPQQPEVTRRFDLTQEDVDTIVFALGALHGAALGDKPPEETRIIDAASKVARRFGVTI